MSYWSYLDEVRRRLWRVVIAFCCVFGLSCYYYSSLLEVIIIPIQKSMPVSGQVISTSLIDLVVAPLHLSMWVSILAVWPYLLLQVWYFFAPAMYPSEKRMVGFWLVLSSLMLWLGLMAGALLLLPQMIKTLLSYMPRSVLFLPDVRLYIQFALQCCFAIGFVSQFPVVLWFCLYFGWITWQQLITARRYVIVISLIMGMLLTPPDVISQLLVAFPMWLLYEITLLFGRFFQSDFNKQCA